MRPRSISSRVASCATTEILVYLKGAESPQQHAAGAINSGVRVTNVYGGGEHTFYSERQRKIAVMERMCWPRRSTRAGADSIDLILIFSWPRRMVVALTAGLISNKDALQHDRALAHPARPRQPRALRS